MQIFEEVLFFKATYSRKTKQITYLLPAQFLRMEEGTSLTHVCAKMQKINDLFVVVFYVVRSFEKEDFLEILTLSFLFLI